MNALTLIDPNLQNETHLVSHPPHLYKRFPIVDYLDKKGPKRHFIKFQFRTDNG